MQNRVYCKKQQERSCQYGRYGTSLRSFFGTARRRNAGFDRFYAPWCSYCRRIAPAYDKLAAQYEGRVTLAKVNVDEEPGLSRQEEIEVLPTMVLYRGGRALGSIVAPESKAMIEAFLEETLAKQ